MAVILNCVLQIFKNIVNEDEVTMASLDVEAQEKKILKLRFSHGEWEESLKLD